jgi:hypothetical protein
MQCQDDRELNAPFYPIVQPVYWNASSMVICCRQRHRGRTDALRHCILLGLGQRSDIAFWKNPDKTRRHHLFEGVGNGEHLEVVYVRMWCKSAMTGWMEE